MNGEKDSSLRLAAENGHKVTGAQEGDPEFVKIPYFGAFFTPVGFKIASPSHQVLKGDFYYKYNSEVIKKITSEKTSCRTSAMNVEEIIEISEELAIIMSSEKDIFVSAPYLCFDDIIRNGMVDLPDDLKPYVLICTREVFSDNKGDFFLFAFEHNGEKWQATLVSFHETFRPDSFRVIFMAQYKTK